eukprot:jgi/Mesen1/2025/ME000148S01133
MDAASTEEGGAVDGLAPREWHKEPCCLGIDEAGRGPVLGAMVYGCAVCPLGYRERLAQQEYADSKVLSEAKREELYGALLADPCLGWAVEVLEAHSLSAQMLRQSRRSLNAISYEAAMGLVRRALGAGVRLAEVYVDTVGDPEMYRKMLEREFPGIKFFVCPKADSLYPIVSAASVVAKVTRDRGLREWVWREQGEVEFTSAFGSGYPGDPVTVAWMEANHDHVFGYPSLVRFSWGTTTAQLKKQGAARVFWEGSQDDDSGPPPGKAVEFQSSASQRHAYFRARQLQQVTTRL